MNLKYTIKKILKEYHPNEDEKSFDEKPNPHQIYIDENGFNKAIEEFRSVEFIAKKLNLTPKKLLEIYDPFKDIFTDEEFKNMLKETIEHIEVRPILKKGFQERTLEKKINMVIGETIDQFHPDLINWDIEPYDWKVPQTPKLLEIIYKDFILDNQTFKRLSLDKNSKLNESNDKFKKRIEDTIKKEGLLFAIKFFGGIENLSKKIDTTPINLVKNFFINKKFSIKDFNISTRNYDYDFKFQVNDIEKNSDDFWSFYVNIIDGFVILPDGEQFDLLNSETKEYDFWFDIKYGIRDILGDILEPLTPNDVEEMDIIHNLDD